MRTLFSRRWLGALALVAVLSVAFYHLGWWQWHRYEAKAQRNELLDSHYNGPAVPLKSVLDPDRRSFPPAAEWTLVSLRGSYARQPTLFVRNRTSGDSVGYEVLDLFVTDGGLSVPIDRGFVGLASSGAQQLPQVAPPGTETTTIEGWLRRSESTNNSTLPPGQLASINVPKAAADWSVATIDGYVLLKHPPSAAGAARPATEPQPLPPPNRDLGPNQAYAYQWWFFIIVIWGLWLYGVTREVRGAPGAATVARVSRWDRDAAAEDAEAASGSQ